MVQPQPLFVLTSHDEGEHCEAGEYNIIAAYPELESANRAAVHYLRRELEDQGEDPNSDDFIVTRFDDSGCINITCAASFNDGRTSFSMRVTQLPAESDRNAIIPSLFSQTPAGPQAQNVFTLTWHEVGEFWEPGDYQVLEHHATLESANQAASRYVRDELEDQGQDPDDEEIVDEGFDESGCVTITCETPFNDGRESFEVRVTQRPLQGVQQTSIPDPKYGPMVTIPVGRPLLAGAKFMFTGTFDTMCRTAAMHAIELYGGTMEKSYDVDFVVVGNNPDMNILRTSRDRRLDMINEKQLFHLLQHGIPSGKVLRVEMH